MQHDTTMNDELVEELEASADERTARDGGDGALPASLVTTELAAAMLRAYLHRNRLALFRIFRHQADDELLAAERFLEQLGEPDAAWAALPPLLAGGQG